MKDLTLVNKLQKAERDFFGVKPDSKDILSVIAKRIEEYEKLDPPKEYQFSIADRYSKTLFNAIARRYGFRPYRYKRQKYTSVMLKVSKHFVDEILWPEFMMLNSELEFYLDRVTNEIIRASVFEDISEEIYKTV